MSPWMRFAVFWVSVALVCALSIGFLLGASA